MKIPVLNSAAHIEQDTRNRRLFETFLNKLSQKEPLPLRPPLKTTTSRRESNTSSSSRKNSKRDSISSKYSKKSQPESLRCESIKNDKSSVILEDLPMFVRSSFPSPILKTSSVTVKNRQTVRIDDNEMKNMEIRHFSSISIVSSTSSISTFVKNSLSIESKPSSLHKLVIPFSGFTEADIVEIRGDRQGSMSSIGTNVSLKRSVLKKEQSEKRKDSYERYLREHPEVNLMLTSQMYDTEDSSYNTVLGVKMMIERGCPLEDEESYHLDIERSETLSKDNFLVVNSDRTNSQTDITTMVEVKEPLILLKKKNAEAKVEDTRITQTEEKLRQELEDLNTEVEALEKEYVEAERKYFVAQSHLHKLHHRRMNLLNQLQQLEKEKDQLNLLRDIVDLAEKS